MLTMRLQINQGREDLLQHHPKSLPWHNIFSNLASILENQVVDFRVQFVSVEEKKLRKPSMRKLNLFYDFLKVSLLSEVIGIEHLLQHCLLSPFPGHLEQWEESDFFVSFGFLNVKFSLMQFVLQNPTLLISHYKIKMWIIYHERLLSLTMIIFSLAPKRLTSDAW